jgi:cytochrome c oxidase subunit 1
VFVPSFTFSALLAKNLIFFAGHMLVNVQIYTGAGLVYALLPHYTGRPWKSSRVLILAWVVAAVFVMLAFFHHLYQDFAQPTSVQVIGEVTSFGVAFPPIVVTIFGGLMMVYRSGIRWTTAPIFLYASLAGWAIGGWAAETGDATPLANQYFHNTVWVPAHFHTYMALGVVFFLLGTVYHVTPQLTGRHLSESIGRRAAALLLVGGWGLVGMWYVAGALSQPRRYPISLPGLENVSRTGMAFAAVVAIGILMIAFDFARTLLREPAQWWARPIRTVPQAGPGPA